jgi:hypothetical protein
MSLDVRPFPLPNEMILQVSEYLSTRDYVAFKFSCRQTYGALNDSKREVLSKKNTMKLCIRSNLSLDPAIPQALYKKPLESLTFFDLALLDRTVTRIVSENFATLKCEGKDLWKRPDQISNLTLYLASLNEKEILESLLIADTGAQIESPCIGNAFYNAASLGHQRVASLLLSNPSGHTFRAYFLEKGLIFSSLNKHSTVVKEILEHPRVAEIRDFAFTRAFSLSTVWTEGASPTSEGSTNSFYLFLNSNKIKAVGVDALYDSISNLFQSGHQTSAEALLRSQRVKRKTYGAILSKAISSRNVEVFRYMMDSSTNSLFTFSGFKKALLTCCKESVADPYFFLAQHPYFEILSKSDLQALLDVFEKLPSEKQNEDDTVAIRTSVFETFSKKVEN